jgi:hypothetical protein
MYHTTQNAAKKSKLPVEDCDHYVQDRDRYVAEPRIMQNIRNIIALSAFFLQLFTH